MKRWSSWLLGERHTELFSIPSMSVLILVLCVILWGTSTFLNRLSVDHLPPVLMQVIAGVVFIFFIPLAFVIEKVNPIEYKWNWHSVVLTIIATMISITANICLYFSLKGSHHTGSSAMIIAMYPAFTFLLSVLFLSEELTVLKIVGLLTMILGAVLLNWR